MPADLDFLENLWQLMLDAQKKNHGFDLTFDEIIEAWGYQSKAAASTYLPELEEAGYVVSKKRGKATVYRALEKRRT